MEKTNIPNIKIDNNLYSQLRQDFHKIPEMGYKEYKTYHLIMEHIKKIPNFEKLLHIHEVPETGVFIDIYGQKKVENTSDKLLISLRADIDGLPFKEMSNFDYKSIHEGMIHGCGHDGHIVILLATLDYYVSQIELIPENFGVRFLFQPAEEGLQGAPKMIENGCLEGVSEIFGLHNITLFKVGEIGVIPGTIMARGDSFEINLKGKGGHGSTPYRCCNPINTGVQIITAINQISSQEINTYDLHAIGIGCFKSGEASNVIPETAVIKGTVRSLKNETGDKIIKRINDISQHISTLNGVEVNNNITLMGGCTTNHVKSTIIVEKIAAQYFEVKTHDLPVLASEDFGFYLDRIPGCFFFLGCKDDDHTGYLHTDTYDFNDKSISIGVEMFIRIIENKISMALI